MNTRQHNLSDVNVTMADRTLSVFASSVLFFYGLRNRGVTGAGAAVLGTGLIARGVTGHCQVYNALGLTTASEEERQKSAHIIRVEKTVTINASAEKLYRAWRDMENLPRFMPHLRSVERRDDQRSHWVAKGDNGLDVHWDSEIILDVENEYIWWRSAEHADVYYAGSVNFRPTPHGRGTEVKSSMWYERPNGVMGKVFAKLFQENPEHQIEDYLHRFKSLMEAGEIPTTVGQPTGSSSLLGKLSASDLIESLH